MIWQADLGLHFKPVQVVSSGHWLSHLHTWELDVVIQRGILADNLGLHFGRKLELHFSGEKEKELKGSGILILYMKEREWQQFKHCSLTMGIIFLADILMTLFDRLINKENKRKNVVFFFFWSTYRNFGIMGNLICHDCWLYIKDGRNTLNTGVLSAICSQENM